MLYGFFWVIPRRLNFVCRRFGTLCLFHRHRQVGMKNNNLFIITNNLLLLLLLFIPTCLRCGSRHSVPKRRHIKFRLRGITWKKTYNIHNTANVWNQERCTCSCPHYLDCSMFCSSEHISFSTECFVLVAVGSTVYDFKNPHQLINSCKHRLKHIMSTVFAIHFR
jgi:hypothetical protein